MDPAVGVYPEGGPMSGNNFIAMVVMILILLFILMSVGPLVSVF
jgi:hypothetical protein